jgi:acyl carrier protein
MPQAPTLLDLINQVQANKRLPPLLDLTPNLRLREDLGFNSLDLAELTVRIEDARNIDIFARGVLRTIGEIEQRLTEETGKTGGH